MIRKLKRSMLTLSTQPLKESSVFSKNDYPKWTLNKQKTSAKRKSVQENGKAMFLFELQLTEQLDQKLKQYRIGLHKLTKRSKVVYHPVKDKVQKLYQPGAT